MTIYTLGYSGWKPQAIKEFLESIDGMAVDVRMVPRSRYAPFNGTSFSRLLRDRYCWVQEFGNANYKGPGPIQIVDFDKGVERIRPLLNSDKSAVLLCGCIDVNVCHRMDLAIRLAKLWGADVVHVPTPAKSAKPKSASKMLTTLF